MTMDEALPWSSLLQCRWKQWSAKDNETLILSLPEHNACDMSGCIKSAQAIMPNVAEIIVFSGSKKNTCYRKRNSKWESFKLK